MMPPSLPDRPPASSDVSRQEDSPAERCTAQQQQQAEEAQHAQQRLGPAPDMSQQTA